jgi:uncharacterized NAD(P)/FAD-binding protein YdhS
VEPLGDWLDPEQAPSTALGLWRLIRQRVAETRQQELDWRAVIDGLRPRTQQLWSRLDLHERRRFLRHVSVIWDVHRHRIAPELQALLDDLQAQGRLRILAARLPANLHLGDLMPAEQHEQARQDRELESEQAQATEEANKEIYNAFLGMFI